MIAIRRWPFLGGSLVVTEVTQDLDFKIYFVTHSTLRGIGTYLADKDVVLQLLNFFVCEYHINFSSCVANLPVGQERGMLTRDNIPRGFGVTKLHLQQCPKSRAPAEHTEHLNEHNEPNEQ